MSLGMASIPGSSRTSVRALPSLPTHPSNASSLPLPTAIDASGIANERFFDVLHSILLSHIRRGNSDGVLALLELPAVSSNPLFRQTCTYREGLVAALLNYVMKHTGQTTVCAPAPGDNAASDDVPQARKENDKAGGQQSGDVEAAPSPASSPSPTTAPDVLTAHDLHALLYRCVFPGEPDRSSQEKSSFVSGFSSPEQLSHLDEEQRGSREAPASSSQYATALSLLLRPWESRPQPLHVHSHPIQLCNREEEEERDLRLYLLTVMRKLKAMLRSTADVQDTIIEASQATIATATRKRPHDSAEVSPSPQQQQARDDTLSIDLAALVAVLEERFSTFTYVNPLTGSRSTGDRSIAEATLSANAVTATASVTVAAADESSMSRSAAAAPASMRGSAVDAAAARERDSDMPPSKSSTIQAETEGADRDDDSVDAIAMLQQLPALSATRWTMPASTLTIATDVAARSKPPAASHAQQRTSSSPGKQHQESSSLGRTETAKQSASSRNQLTNVSTPQPQQDAEQARVSNAIRAFDAFAAALEQRPTESRGNSHHDKKSNDDDGFMPAQRHRSAAPPSTAAEPTTTAAASAQRYASRLVDAFPPHSPCMPPPSPSSSRATTVTTTMTTTEVAAREAEAAHLPALTPPPRNTAPSVRRRHKFSAKEDAAILHGVAQFGQASGAFRYIFYAYRNVWLAGRTPTHLYDHWRGALRRRAMEAVNGEMMSDAEREEGQQQESGPTSDIEDSSLEDAEG